MAATTLNPIAKTHPGIEDRIAQYRLSLPIIVCVVWLGGCAAHRPCPASPIPDSTVADHACRIDGCTLAPDFNFAACCDAHDVAYWQGGNADQRPFDSVLPTGAARRLPRSTTGARDSVASVGCPRPGAGDLAGIFRAPQRAQAMPAMVKARPTRLLARTPTPSHERLETLDTYLRLLISFLLLNGPLEWKERHEDNSTR